jgi:uncharacterized protein
MRQPHLYLFILCVIPFTCWTASGAMDSSPEHHRELFSVSSSDDVVLQGEKWSSALASDPLYARPLFIFVHQYTVMGGSRQLMAGMARHAVSCGYEAVTFDLRGAGGSSGSCTFRNRSERDDVLAVVRHLEQSSPRPLLLVGSSAGAALAGSVLDSSARVLGGVFVGYTWGWGASLLFGWAFASLQHSSKPKLFVVGTADEFTSMAQYASRVAGLAGSSNEVAVIEGKNHFQIEAPEYDQFVVDKAVAMAEKISSMVRDEAGGDEEACSEEEDRSIE